MLDQLQHRYEDYLYEKLGQRQDPLLIPNTLLGKGRQVASAFGGLEVVHQM
jgi:hypothetical protein